MHALSNNEYTADQFIKLLQQEDYTFPEKGVVVKGFLNLSGVKIKVTKKLPDNVKLLGNLNAAGFFTQNVAFPKGWIVCGDMDLQCSHDVLEAIRWAQNMAPLVKMRLVILTGSTNLENRWYNLDSMHNIFESYRTGSMTESGFKGPQYNARYDDLDCRKYFRHMCM